jgi:competence protein ComEC
MQKQLHKILLFCLACIFVLLGILMKEELKSAGDGYDDINRDSSLQVHFLDVGQGDAILIQTPYEQNILIDGGPDSSVLYGIGKVLPFYDHEIDIMILTHPHSDHVAGLIDVLKKYDVKKIYYTGVIHTTPDYISWLEEIKSQKIPLEIIKEPKVLNLGQDLTLEFLYPLKSYAFTRVKELNNTSIVNKLVYGNTSFLLTGDAEAEVEEELLHLGVDLSADVFKAGHHGSTSSSTQEFCITC